MKKWSWKAILGAWAIKFFGWMLIQELIWIAVSVSFYAAGRGPAQIVATYESPLITFSLIIISTGCNVLVGYLCAWWAPRNKMGHALILGFFTLVVNLLLVKVFHPPQSYLFIYLLTVPTILAGGWWRVKTRGAENPPPVPQPHSPSAPPIAAP